MIYFMRHAQSTANRDGIYAGSTIDVALTDYGKAMMNESSKKNTIRFDKVYVSALRRSIESGNIFLSNQDFESELIKDARLNELDFGRLAGKTYTDFDSEKSYEKFNIEEKAEFYERVKSFYDEITESNAESDILIIAHSGVGKMLHAIVNGTSYNDYNRIHGLEDYTIYRLS